MSDSMHGLFQRMRDAADVMREVNALFREKYPTAGFSPNEPISESSMRHLADQWEEEADE